jgi:hypothetical protein
MHKLLPTLLAWVRRAGVATAAAVACAALAAGTCSDYLNALAMRESGLNPRAHNQFGYVGLWQMGEAALIDAGYYRADGTGTNDWRGSWTGLGGITSLEAFKASPAAQAAAVAAYQQRVWGYVRSLGLDRYVGSSVAGLPITQSGLVAAAHLVGTGNLARYLRSGGTVVPADGNGTLLTEYLASFGGYQIFGAGADCADWAQGQATGGVSPPAGPSPAPAAGTATFGSAPGAQVDRGEAFYGMTGHSAGDVGSTIRLAAASVLLALAAWSCLGNWSLFAGGRLPQHLMLSQNWRLGTVVIVLLVLLS